MTLLRLAIELAWQSGRDYIPDGLDDALDDARHASITPPHRTHEDRVQERIKLFERCAASHDTHPGGSVPLW